MESWNRRMGYRDPAKAGTATRVKPIRLMDAQGQPLKLVRAQLVFVGAPYVRTKGEYGPSVVVRLFYWPQGQARADELLDESVRLAWNRNAPLVDGQGKAIQITDEWMAANLYMDVSPKMTLYARAEALNGFVGGDPKKGVDIGQMIGQTCWIELREYEYDLWGLDNKPTGQKAVRTAVSKVRGLNPGEAPAAFPKWLNPWEGPGKLADAGGAPAQAARPAGAQQTAQRVTAPGDMIDWYKRAFDAFRTPMDAAQKAEAGKAWKARRMAHDPGSDPNVLASTTRRGMVGLIQELIAAADAGGVDLPDLPDGVDWIDEVFPPQEPAEPAEAEEL